MSSRNEHCAAGRRELGGPSEQIRTWPDYLCKVLGPKHRSARHHA